MMMRNRYAVAILLLAPLAVACDDDSNGAPTTNTVVLYQDTNFRGDSRALLTSAPDLDDLPGCGGAGDDWNDCISSIRIPSGWEVTVFEEDDYEGARMTFAADVADLEQQPGPCGDDWDDCISSIQVRQP